MSTYGIKISKPGKDITSNAANDLVFDSRRNAFKVFKEGSGTMSAGAATIPHGLNFTPAFLAFAQIETGQWFSIGMDITIPSSNTFTGYTDATNLNLQSNLANASYYYYIFGDTAKDLATSSPFTKGTFGVAVSKPMSSVDNLFVENFITSTDLPSLKVATAASLTVNTTSQNIFTVNHNQPFTPAFMAFASTDNVTFYSLPNIANAGAKYYAYMTSTQLNLAAYPGVGINVYFKYVIFADKIA